MASNSSALIFPIGPLAESRPPVWILKLGAGRMCRPCARLKLVIGPRESVQVFYNPSILEAIDHGEFSALVIDEKNFTNSEAFHAGSAANDDLKHVLMAASKWTQLDSLTLQNMALADDELAVLSKYPALTHLDLFGVHFNADAMAKQPFLHRLKLFWIREAEDIGAVCLVLKDVANIENVKLLRSQVSARDLEPLLAGEHVQVLAIEQKELRSLVPCLIRHRSLKQLLLHGQTLTGAEIRCITACPSISQLRLHPNDYTNEEIDQYKQYPKVAFAGGRD